MDTIKQPAMILSITNTVLILAIMGYMYKKNTGVEAKLEDLEKKLSIVITSLGDEKSPQNPRNLPAILHGVGEELKLIRGEMANNKNDSESIFDMIGENFNTISELPEFKTVSFEDIGSSDSNVSRCKSKRKKSKSRVSRDDDDVDSSVSRFKQNKNGRS